MRLVFWVNCLVNRRIYLNMSLCDLINQILFSFFINPSSKEKHRCGVFFCFFSFMGILFSRNVSFKFFLPFLFLNRISGNLFPKELQNMVCMVSRTGRDLQRYDDDGCRQIVGYVYMILF